ncbi:MAG: flagellar basal body-associated FliL family protein [Gammaproteobacteria bacterium]|jgi:flagellar FliL protein|nr:flagellar basal body-associated FliL family protein [Gammaproteobacteria bacterium]
MKKIILIVVGVLLLGAVAAGAMLFLKEAPPAEGDAEGEVTEKAPKVAEPIYQGLDPDFVVAFQNPKTVRFIKLSVEVMARDDDVIEAVKLHMPAIRDRVIMLLSTKDEDSLLETTGKEKLREELLAAVQVVLNENTGAPGIEAVYFTNFVMQ